MASQLLRNLSLEAVHCTKHRRACPRLTPSIKVAFPTGVRAMAQPEILGPLELLPLPQGLEHHTEDKAQNGERKGREKFSYNSFRLIHSKRRKKKSFPRTLIKQSPRVFDDPMPKSEEVYVC